MIGFRRRHRAFGPAVFLLLAVCGCEEQDSMDRTERLRVRTVWQQPAEDPDPLLVFPRDLLRADDRLYVLDGRLARVAVFDAWTGAPTGEVFGGVGEGPGEIGLFPYALVGDGERIGTAHLFTVSWFSPEGTFLEREPLPPLDLSTPSLQRTERGWLYNAGFRGTGSPLARLAGADGDTLRIGSSGTPPGGHTPLAAVEWNAVHAVRVPTALIILGRVQQNLIEVFDPEGGLLRTERWRHLPTEPERSASGRPRGLAGFTMGARLGADGRAYLLDGTLRRVRVYGPDARLERELELEAPILAAAWGTGPRLFAIDGSDRLLFLEPSGMVPVSSEGPGRGEAGVEGAGGLEILIEDLRAFLEEHLVLRPRRLSGPASPPNIPRIAAGEAGFFLGYEDGQGVFLQGGLAPDAGVVRIDPHPRGSSRTEVIPGPGGPWLLAGDSGLYPLIRGPSPATWGRGVGPVDRALRLADGNWLLHAMGEQAPAPLMLLGSDGEARPAGGEGQRAAADPDWSAAWNEWYLLGWGAGALVFDASLARSARWQEGAMGPWRPLMGTPFRPISERFRAGVPQDDFSGVLSVPSGWIVVWDSDFEAGETVSRLWVLDAEGRLVTTIAPPIPDLITSVASDGAGGLLLLTRASLYRLSGWEPPSPPDPVRPPPPWLGAGLLDGLGTLRRLDGSPGTASTEGLRVWVLVSDRACPSCLLDLPDLLPLMKGLGLEGNVVSVVALGDRHEARRTFWGTDPGMPVYVAGGDAAGVGVSAIGKAVRDRGPLLLVTLDGGSVVLLPFDLADAQIRADLERAVEWFADPAPLRS